LVDKSDYPVFHKSRLLTFLTFHAWIIYGEDDVFYVIVEQFELMEIIPERDVDLFPCPLIHPQKVFSR
jgi:hypothetical protein